MKTIGTICFAISLILYAIDFGLMTKYCSAGFMGYPDIWYNKRAEKIHGPLALSSVVLILLSAILMALA